VHRARKSLGQNFLIDPNIQQKIVDAVAPDADTEVLEIGPGTGALTHRLAGRTRRLTAIELDDDLARSLETEFHGRADVRILHGDALDLDVRTVTDAPDRLTIVGNIPYNITTPLIFHLLEREHRPATVVLMVQREVAERILARPGEKEYGALSVGVRAVADVDRLFHVGRGAFRPVPNVDSTVLRITPHRPPRLSAGEEDDLRTLTRAAFGWRRKQLQKILRSAPEYGLDAAAVDALAARTGHDLRARPEDLAPGEFIALARALRDFGLPATEPSGPTPLRRARGDAADARP
jgi:16S rRNA (adenine1518-N6/adenine1519-N6)-dimethyltransferase